MDKQVGLTFIEMMMVLVLLGIAAVLVGPHLGQAGSRSFVSGFASELSHGIQTARSEAMARGKTVNISSINNNWANGWHVWVDSNKNGRFESGPEPLLLEKRINNRGLSLTANPGVQSIAISSSGAFQVAGSTNSSVVTFSLCLERRGQQVRWNRFGQTEVREVGC